MTIIEGIIILIPITVLLKQYQVSKSKDYLIFSLAFISIFIEIFLDTILSVNSIPDSDSNFTDNSYLFLLKVRYINFTIPSSIFFIIARRTRDQAIWNKKALFMAIWWIWTIIFILLWKLQTIPEYAGLLSLTLHSTVESGVVGGIFIKSGLIIGQGYEMYFLLYQTTCLIYFIYAFVKLENKFNYEHFRKVSNLWTIMLTFWTVGNLFKILHNLNLLLISETNIMLIQFGSFILVFDTSVFYAEALLLSEAQVSRIIHLYNIASTKRKDKGSTLLASKTMDYLQFLECNYKEDFD